MNNKNWKKRQNSYKFPAIPVRISEIPGNSRREILGSRFPGILDYRPESMTDPTSPKTSPNSLLHAKDNYLLKFSKYLIDPVFDCYTGN